MDSVVTMAIAKEQGFVCYALSVSYGQRHGAELDAANEPQSSANSLKRVLSSLLFLSDNMNELPVDLLSILR